MSRPTKTTSGRWEVKGEKWEHKAGDDWRSKRQGAVDLKKIGPWVEDMEEWGEMMYEAVMELREQQAALRQDFIHIGQEFTQLSAFVKTELGKLPGGVK